MSAAMTQPLNGQEFPSISKNSQKSGTTVHPWLSGRRRPPRMFIPDDRAVQLFSEWEVMFLCTIVNSTNIIQGRERRIYWCSRAELVNQHGESLYSNLRQRQAITEWLHPQEFIATTLTPWSASVLGVRLSEYWVRWLEYAQEYRGVGRRPAKIRVQRWDTESYWTYRGRPERAIRIPSNTCELPLIGDPEDKNYQKENCEYLCDWQTWTFCKNPKKALALTIRVGCFTHKIKIQRDTTKLKRRPTKKKQRRHHHARSAPTKQVT